MMGTIHVNTDEMRLLGRRFIECNEYIRSQLIPELQRLSIGMENDWIGVSRVHYDGLFQHWIQSALSLENWGEEIGQHVSQTAQQFDNADRSL
ncbi:MAG: WXG100 family type VII secretion target [Ktedonobacteraceae bacterium]|nr:WXG100 family type VII secretion target [Ktedonobacteraceae bacterium]